MDEIRYLVLVHDWSENEHYPIGVYTTEAKAGEAMDGYMADMYGLNEYTDWERDTISGSCSYFYDDFTVDIQRMITDA